MNKLITFARECKEEMINKVSWPKYVDLQSSSVLVLVASLIFALVIGVIDLAFNEITQWYYNAF